MVDLPIQRSVLNRLDLYAQLLVCTVMYMSEEIETLLGFGVFHLSVSCDISQ